MAFRLIALYALFKIDKQPGHVLSERENVDNFIKKALASRDRISASMDWTNHVTRNCEFKSGGTSSIDGCISRSEKQKPGCKYRPTNRCDILVDGQIITQDIRESFPFNAANKAAFEVQVNNAIEGAATPFRKQQEDFLTQTNAALHFAASCYAQMCEKAGGKYDIPKEVVSFKPFTVNATIMQMPGATVNFSR